MQASRLFLEALGNFAQAHAGQGVFAHPAQSEATAEQLFALANERLDSLKKQFASIKRQIEAKDINGGYMEKKIAEIRGEYPSAAIDWSLFQL